MGHESWLLVRNAGASAALAVVRMTAVASICAVAAGPAYAAEPVPSGDAVVESAEVLPPWVDLSPAEEHTADAVVVAAPGETVEAQIQPEGCDNVEECGYVVKAAGAPMPAGTGVFASAAAGRRVVAPMGGAKIGKVKVKSAPRRVVATAAALDIRYWTINDDHVCSIYSCTAWEIQLNSKAYADGTYAWGSRSRYGYAGWANKNGTKGLGYSVSTDRLGFAADPSRSDMYATHDATVSAFVKGVPISATHYVHRHYTGNYRSWLVVG